MAFPTEEETVASEVSNKMPDPLINKEQMDNDMMMAANSDRV
jgi:hypothetical protein